MTKIVDKRTLLSTFSSIYHTILLNRIRWLVVSWSILLYLRFDSNGSLSQYDVQKHRNVAAFLLFMLSGVAILARLVHFESDDRRYVSNISGWFSYGVMCFGFAFFIMLFDSSTMHLSVTEDYCQTTTTFQVVIHLAVDSWFQLPIPVFVSGAWILDSDRQWPGFRVPWAVLRIPKPRSPDSTFKNFSDSGIPIPLHEASRCVPHRYLNLFITNRLELKMPPKKKHKPLEGQTWLLVRE